MDQRGDRCRTGHRVRQPDVERDLRALADAAEEHEETDRRYQCAPHSEIERLRAHTGEVEHTDVREQHEHRDQESEVADAVDDECLLAGVSVRLVVEPEPNQQVGAEPDPLPADEQHRIVGAQDQHQHEEDEQIQVREVPRVSRVLPHIAHAEDVNERPNARDDENHHHRELIQLEGGVDL